MAVAMKHLLSLLFTLTTIVVAQQPLAIVSPDVQFDGKVTFHLLDPNAKDVKLQLEGEPKPLDMTRDDSGVWSLTFGPLAPQIYGYIFIADGVLLMDPNNPVIKPNLIQPENMVHVSGTSPTLWEVAEVPHGVVHHHLYKSKLVGDQRDYFVYTPPGFDPRARMKYPVLYLLHGYSDGADGWTAVGKANIILDNLIAQGKVKPMIVVMPFGYGTPQMLKQKWEHNEFRLQNYQRFAPTLLDEVMPMVESAYPISAKAADRAIAGLSMGGAESLLVGLNHLDKFSQIGAFSSGELDATYPASFPGLGTRQSQGIRLLWVSCGIADSTHIDHKRELKAWLKSQNIPFTDIETPGAHTWMVWRDNLINFVQLLFNGR